MYALAVGEGLLEMRHAIDGMRDVAEAARAAIRGRRSGCGRGAGRRDAATDDVGGGEGVGDGDGVGR